MKNLITTICFAAIIHAGFAQNANHVSVEIDPAPYILKGYSVSLKYSAAAAPQAAYMFSVYQSDFPDGMMKKTNRDNGWSDLKLRTSFAFFYERYLNEKRKGFHYGASVFLYRKSVFLSSADQRISFESLYPNIRAGYTWYPFRNCGLYLNPWLNAGTEFSIAQKPAVNGKNFELNRFNYIAALHIGYAFSFSRKAGK